MSIEVVPESIERLPELAQIPIAFDVNAVLEIGGRAGDNGAFVLAERRLEMPYRKDYDVIAGESPREWARRFDVSRWGLLGAHRDGTRIGAAVIAFDTAGVDMLAGRRDLAVLWNIRVAPAERRRGVGAALLRAVEAWAAARGCTEIDVETQDTNVPACRFYSREGFALHSVNLFAYPDFPREAQLLWGKRI